MLWELDATSVHKISHYFIINSSTPNNSHTANMPSALLCNWRYIVQYNKIYNALGINLMCTTNIHTDSYLTEHIQLRLFYRLAHFTGGNEIAQKRCPIKCQHIYTKQLKCRLMDHLLPLTWSTEYWYLPVWHSLHLLIEGKKKRGWVFVWQRLKSTIALYWFQITHFSFDHESFDHESKPSSEWCSVLNEFAIICELHQITKFE